ncbi:DUF6282 family protein [Neorhizobium sp. Rsf11]|uniref:DUF6282 family protein n=2 Tax=Rhizobium/Agrobacterium group TaxID=227290 RepID=A0ABV0M4R1_9HYPH
MSSGVLARSHEPPGHLTGWLSGSVDMACDLEGLLHPDTGLDSIEIGAQALELGIRAVVLQAHDYCTAPVAAYLADADFKDTPIALFGSVALNTTVGGLNVYAVEHTLMLAGKVVHMPTLSAENFLRSQRWPSRLPVGFDGAEPALSVVSARGRVLPELKELLEVIATRDGVLGAGFLHTSELLALFEAAKVCGVTRLLVSDPVRNNGARPGDVDRMLRQGAYIMISASSQGRDRMLAASLARTHPERLILGLHSAEASGSLRSHYIAALRGWLELGLDEGEIRRAIGDNPRRLLGLEERIMHGTHLHA